MRLSQGLAGVSAASMMVATASAHPVGHGSQAESFSAGFAHPLLGFDHFLAMFTVGLLAVQKGGKAIWAYPLAFVGAMLFGSILPSLPLTETGIFLSLVGLGFFVVLAAVGSKREQLKKQELLTTLLHAAGIVLFGLFHGHAHGTEMPMGMTFSAFGLGFSLATGLLHGAGIALGSLLLISHRAPVAFRAVGTLVMAAGFFALING